MEGKEKRKWVRVPYQIEAQLDIEGEKLCYPVIQNISMEGIFIKADEILSVGKSGKIVIALEFGENKMQVKANCTVVRSESEGMGIKFTYIDPDSSIILYNMIKYQL